MINKFAFTIETEEEAAIILNTTRLLDRDTTSILRYQEYLKGTPFEWMMPGVNAHVALGYYGSADVVIKSLPWKDDKTWVVDIEGVGEDTRAGVLDCELVLKGHVGDPIEEEEYDTP